METLPLCELHRKLIVNRYFTAVLFNIFTLVNSAMLLHIYCVICMICICSIYSSANSSF